MPVRVLAASLPEPRSEARIGVTPEPPPLDVAFFVYDLRGSGVVRNALRIAAAAQTSGLEVEIWTIRATGSFASQVPRGCRVVELASLRGLRTRLRFLDMLLNIGSLAKAISKRRPAVLFSTGNHAHLPVSLAYRRAGSPDATKLVGRVSNALAQPSMISAGLAGPFDAARRLLSRLELSTMHHLVAVSSEIARDVVATGGFEPDRVRLIPNGVDIEAGAISAAERLDHPWLAPGQPPVVLGVGRLSRQKNFELLIDAFALARAKMPVRLVILGEGSARARHRLEQRARRLGVGADIEIAGYHPNPHWFMARAGLFALSSRWEGASNVLLEAMAQGCPVVATDCPSGVREVLQGGLQGRLVPVGSAEHFAAAMIESLKSSRRSEELRRRAAAYSLHATLERYVRLIRSVQEDSAGEQEPAWTGHGPERSIIMPAEWRAPRPSHRRPRSRRR